MTVGPLRELFHIPRKGQFEDDIRNCGKIAKGYQTKISKLSTNLSHIWITLKGQPLHGQRAHKPLFASRPDVVRLDGTDESRGQLSDQLIGAHLTKS